MPPVVRKLCLVAASTLVGLILVEALYRWLGPDPNDPGDYGWYHLDAERREISAENDNARQLLRPVAQSPRPRPAWAPNATIYLCYRGSTQPYFDAQGCVEMRFNSRGVRDREELCAPKPEGQRRIVCLGDSFTLGWGVRIEDCWTRLTEEILRRTDDGIRTVNCGFAGTLFVDEYWWGLKHRFHAFEPDVVLVTLCLNDLLATNGSLVHLAPPITPWWSSRLLGTLTRGSDMPPAFQLDPERDWVQEILDLPADDPIYQSKAGREAYWAAGGPQEALRAMHAWCRERGVRLGVVVWPLFQGLADSEFYPFAKMHGLVQEFCADEGIPMLDLLPTFLGRNTVELWVSPTDYHGNDVAQRIAAPPIAEFAEGLLGS